MAINKRLLVKPPSTGITPSEHFGVVLYEGDGSSSNPINGGKFGAAASFSGSSKISVLPLSFNLQPYSVSCWFNTYDLANYRSIWGVQTLGANGTLRVSNTGKLDFYMYSNPHPNLRIASATNTLSANTWYHAVALWDGSNIKLYINGSLAASDTATSMRSYESNYFDIGGDYASYFKGKIDQFRVFHKALSSSEISTLYAETVSTVESLDPLSEDTTDTLQVLGDSSCIATYRFENDETDLSGNYDGTGTQIQYAAGRYGQAASFNGSASKVDIGNLGIGGASTRTVSAWINTNSLSSAQTIFQYGTGSNGARFGFAIDTTGKPYVEYYNRDVITSAGHISVNTWYHLVVTYNGNAIETATNTQIYVNGSAVSMTTTGAQTGSANTTNSDYGIGYRRASSTQYFNGEIDQLRVFNKALSASEVTTLYNENSLVASYRFEGNANDDTRNYNGTASNVTFENSLNFTPDFVWIKNRSQAVDHGLYDSSRGATKYISPNTANAQGTYSTVLTSFDTGGFTVGNNSGVNYDGNDFVAWCLKANGGTTSSNTDGNVTTTVQVNETAGFSIGTMSSTGISSSQTFGHGLGNVGDGVPDLLIVKGTSLTSEWRVYSSALNNYDGFLQLYTTAALYTASIDSTFNSSTFNLQWTGTAQDWVFYAFKEIEGFSSFGTYSGNGSTNGPIVETGFEPAFLMVKRTDSADGWIILDNKRDLTNPRDNSLKADESSVEENNSVNRKTDFLSNGFQLKHSHQGMNASGGTYFYMAFAADPDTVAPPVAKSFSTVTYTGTGSAQTIEGLGFKPSLLWTKQKDGTFSHIIHDTLNQPHLLITNSTGALITNGSNTATFTDDGFSLEGGANHTSINNSGSNFVAWAWKANDNEPTYIPAVGPGSVDDVYPVVKYYNITYTTSGKFNGGYVFNGIVATGTTGSAIFVPQFERNTSIDFTQSGVSASGWFYSTGTPGGTNSHVLFSMYGDCGFNIQYNSSRTIIYSGAINGSTNKTMPSNTWTHIAFTYSSSGYLKVYVDGSVSGTYNVGTSALQSGSPRVNGIGGVADNGNHTGPTSWFYAFQGTISQVRYFNSELTQANVNTLYGETSSDNDTLDILGDGKCIAAYKLSEALEDLAVVSANANAGFSIVKYTGTGVSGTKVPHGLSAAPDMVIAKGLSGTATSWWVQHIGLSSGYVLELNGTAAEANWSSPFNNTAASSTVVTLGNGDTNRSGETQILYCFHSVSGFSKFGSYTGTGTTNSITGLGFQPDWLMIKRATGGSSNGWIICDSVRGVGVNLRADTNGAEVDESAYTTSFDSDGFTLAQAGGNTNVSGSTYIYAAFKIN